MSRTRISFVVLAVYVSFFVLSFFYYIAQNCAFDSHRLLNVNDSGGYGEMADAFLHGQVSLLTPADPRLDHSANPWIPRLRDPKASFGWDQTYYRAKGAEKGKLYSYFGPAPALLLMIPTKLLFGVWPSQSMAYFIVAYVNLILYAIFLRLLIVQFKLLVPLYFQALLLMMYVCCNLLNYMMILSWTYQIAAAFSVTAALAFAIYVVLILRGDQWRPLYLLLASSCAGIAFTSRPTAISLYLLLGVIWVFLYWKEYRQTSLCSFPVLRDTLLTMGPALLCLGGYLIYNKVRFESFFEFGLKYQLNEGQNYAHTLFSPYYLLDSLWSYYFRPWAFTSSPPYLDRMTHIWINGVSVERERTPMTGLLTEFPINCAALFWPIYVLRLSDSKERTSLLLFGLLVTVWVVVSTLISSCYYAHYYRYALEQQLALLLLTTICLLSYRHQKPYRPGMFIFFSFLLIYSCFFGLFFGAMGECSWLQEYLNPHSQSAPAPLNQSTSIRDYLAANIYDLMIEGAGYVVLAMIVSGFFIYMITFWKMLYESISKPIVEFTTRKLKIIVFVWLACEIFILGSYLEKCAAQKWNLKKIEIVLSHDFKVIPIVDKESGEVDSGNVTLAGDGYSFDLPRFKAKGLAEKMSASDNPDFRNHAKDIAKLQPPDVRK